MEASVWNLTTWLSVALGILWDTEYLQKAFPKGTPTSWNVLEFAYHLVGDPVWLLSIPLGSPLFTE